MPKLIYNYLGYKQTPKKWLDGKVVEYGYSYCWYIGAEEIKESDVKTRIKELEQITNEFGHKKYRNIQVIE